MKTTKTFLKNNRSYIISSLSQLKSAAHAKWRELHPGPKRPEDRAVLKEVRALKLLLQPREKERGCFCRVDLDSLLETPLQREHRIAMAIYSANKKKFEERVEKLHKTAFEAVLIKGENFLETRAALAKALTSEAL